jgi:squalene cyclase
MRNIQGMSTVEASAIDYLISNQNDDGGWGYLPGQSSTVESTSVAVLALQDKEGVNEIYDRGFDWLIDAQNKDGGWGISTADSQSGWQSTWALIALANGESDPGIIQLAVDWILSFEAFKFTDTLTQEQYKDLFSIDQNLSGWPWRPGEASWVEPTALSLIALASASQSKFNNEKIDEAVHYLNDRRCNVGGWNIGSPSMFSKDVPPRTHTTALALLGLNLTAPEVIQPKDITTLKDIIGKEDRPLAIAFGIIALESLSQDTGQQAERLMSLQEPDGSWERNCLFTAAALLALSQDIKLVQQEGYASPST